VLRRTAGVLALLISASILRAENPTPVLKMPGAADKPIAPALLLGKSARDVRLEDTAGNVTIYHGLPLLEVLESNGLDLKTMSSERQTAATVVLASSRDGYAVVFSVGELKLNRADPKVFLVAETSAGPLPENQGPVRLIVYGDRARSSYGLARIELKSLADNPKTPKN
jgi:hypothetical protein